MYIGDRRLVHKVDRTLPWLEWFEPTRVMTNMEIIKREGAFKPLRYYKIEEATLSVSGSWYWRTIYEYSESWWEALPQAQKDNLLQSRTRR